RYYGPFLSTFGEPRGLYVANGVLLALATILAALAAARASASRIGALAAMFCVLFPSFTYFELFSQGVNDLLPTVLLLVALLASHSSKGPLRSDRARAAVTGLALGLSLAAKPLPGALFLLLLPGTVATLPFVAGVGLGLCTYLPDLI